MGELEREEKGCEMREAMALKIAHRQKNRETTEYWIYQKKTEWKLDLRYHSDHTPPETAKQT